MTIDDKMRLVYVVVLTECVGHLANTSIFCPTLMYLGQIVLQFAQQLAK